MQATREQRGTGGDESGLGFGRLLGLTIVGALVPGSGLLIAGRRALGGIVLATFISLSATLAILLWTGDAVDVAIAAAARPGALTAAGIGSALVAVLWSLVIVGSHLALRRKRLRLTQQVLAGLLVAALCAAVTATGGEAARYAFIQRDMVDHVFGNEPVPATDPTAPSATHPNTEPLQPPRLVARDPWRGTPHLNVLLLGSDAGPGRIGMRPDSLIVASIDTHTGNTVLISLPRNLRNVPFPESSPLHDLHPHGYDCGDQCLLNAVWRNVGEAHGDVLPGDRNPGLTATWQAVEATLGIELDHYVLVNMRGFVDVIDALGGVTVDVHQPLVVGDPAAPTEVISPGVQHLDGRQALWFARVRQGYDDYDRMRRQRCLLGDLVDQANPARLVARLPHLAASAMATIRTDIPREELSAYAELARRVKDARISSLAFTNAVIDTRDPDFGEIRRLTRRAIAATEAPRRDPVSGPADSLVDLC